VIQQLGELAADPLEGVDSSAGGKNLAGAEAGGAQLAEVCLPFISCSGDGIQGATEIGEGRVIH